MTLKLLMEEIKETIGLFSKSYKTMDEHHHEGHVQNIPFKLKPAQQFLAGLGVSDNQHVALSSLANIIPLDVTIKHFSPKKSASELKISAARVSRLLQSSKIYVNTDLCPAGLYNKAMQHGLVSSQDTRISDDTQIHWQNLAVGICHSQEIDLLISTTKSHNGRALTTARKGVIEKEAPAILLLSNPTLKFKNGFGKKLDRDTRIKFIEGMYRNIFNAAINEGRYYIAMPAGGLGKSGGKAELYFAALMKVARDFPSLNIIYNPATHVKKFDDALHKANLANVARTNKNVVFIADKLTQQGKLCALFNQSTSDVAYGLCDIGECWKRDENHNFDGENYIGSTTTAPLNSYGLNQHAYKNIVEHSFADAAVIHIPERPITPRHNQDDVPSEPPPSQTRRNSEKPLPVPETRKTPTPKPQPMPLQDRDPVPQPLPVSDISIPAVETSIINSLPSMSESTADMPVNTPPVSNKIIEISSVSSSGLFRLDSVISSGNTTHERQQSNFNDEQIDTIESIILGLKKELASCWPYPNKDLKQIKINALNSLMIEAQTHSVEDAVKLVKKQFPRVTEGSFSTRTAGLLDKLEQDARGVALTR